MPINTLRKVCRIKKYIKFNYASLSNTTTGDYLDWFSNREEIMKVTILDDYQDAVRTLECFKLLEEFDVEVLNQSYGSPDELAGKLLNSDALVLIRERTEINEQLLSQLPSLRLISQTGKVSNHLDMSACTKFGVAVSEGVGSPLAPSEFCWALVLAASRHIPAYVSSLKANKWQNSGSLGLGRSLKGLTFGIWGYGNIGRKVAGYAKVFGMNVLVWGSESSRLQAQKDGFSAANDKGCFFAQSDILSLHLRLNLATRGCVSEVDLKSMKPDSLFVNISRAELIEDGALYNALSSGVPKYAALDVFNNEPFDNSSEPLLNLPNVLCTPHLGYVEKNNYELYFKIAFENVANYFNGEPSNIADKEVLPE